jgi:hypothetical protein
LITWKARNEKNALVCRKGQRLAWHTIRITAWDGVYQVSETDATRRVPEINGPTSAIDANQTGVIALHPDNDWRETEQTNATRSGEAGPRARSAPYSSRLPVQHLP